MISPGPWKHVDEECRDEIRCPEWTVVGMCEGEYEAMTKEDAHLIAAAPEILEALIDETAWSERVEFGGDVWLGIQYRGWQYDEKDIPGKMMDGEAYTMWEEKYPLTQLLIDIGMVEVTDELPLPELPEVKK